MTFDQRQEAIRRIRSKRELRVHITVYLAVNALLVVIWAMTGAGYFWPVWPMLGWGIAVVIHAVTIYGGPSQITEEQIEREMNGGRSPGSEPAPASARYPVGPQGRQAKDIDAPLRLPADDAESRHGMSTDES